MKELRKVEYKYYNETKIGKFHEWGIDSFVIKNKGIGNKTMAIIETEDGNILMIKPNRIKFVEEVKDETLEKFKLGKIGVNVKDGSEYFHIVRLFKNILPNGINYMSEEDIDDFHILRIEDEDSLNGYWTASSEDFEVIEFEKFKEELLYDEED